MTFADPVLHERRRRRGARHYSTIEVGHDGARSGMIVEVDEVRGGERLRALLEQAFDVAGAQRRRDPASPGWWVACICAAGIQAGLVCRVQRVPGRAYHHALVLVERAPMLAEHPDWPLTRLHPAAPWLDLRGETALRRGPSDGELLAFGASKRLNEPAIELRRLFELGVLEWEPGEVRSGRRGICAAMD